jgi:HSP20 family protein
MLLVKTPFMNDLFKFDSLNSIFDVFAREDELSSLGFKLDKNGNYISLFSLPGVSSEHLTVEVTKDRLLTVKAEVKTDNYSNSFNHTLSLPKDADIDSLTADLKDGLLTISMKKIVKQTSEAKKIKVNMK